MFTLRYPEAAMDLAQRLQLLRHPSELRRDYDATTAQNLVDKVQEIIARADRPDRVSLRR